MKRTPKYILMGLLMTGPFGPHSLAHHKPGHTNGNGGNKPLKITELDQLEFGTIAPSTTLSGYVDVSPQTDNTSVCDPNLTCIESGDRARFRITGRRNHSIDISISSSILLTNKSGQTMHVDQFRYNASGFGQGFGYLSGNGAVELGVGARLKVGANQPPGAYTGNFEINVYYQ